MLGKHIVLERKQLVKRGRVKHFCISYLVLSLASARQISSASVCFNCLGEENRRYGYAAETKASSLISSGHHFHQLGRLLTVRLTPFSYRLFKLFITAPVKRGSLGRSSPKTSRTANSSSAKRSAEPPAV